MSNQCPLYPKSGHWNRHVYHLLRRNSGSLAKFADMNAYCDQLDRLIARLGVKTIAPTHGLPITDVKATVPKVQEGLKAAALMPESGTNEKLPLNSAAASVA
jgi:TPP-dependent indolepyruvate ferredoxin oxidoreductase alpha subunit